MSTSHEQYGLLCRSGAAHHPPQLQGLLAAPPCAAAIVATLSAAVTKIDGVVLGPALTLCGNLATVEAFLAQLAASAPWAAITALLTVGQPVEVLVAALRLVARALRGPDAGGVDEARLFLAVRDLTAATALPLLSTVRSRVGLVGGRCSRGAHSAMLWTAAAVPPARIANPGAAAAARQLYAGGARR